MWRVGFKTPRNYNDNELFCGGFTVNISSWNIVPTGEAVCESRFISDQLVDPEVCTRRFE